jgi:hypothetical protein
MYIDYINVTMQLLYRGIPAQQAEATDAMAAYFPSSSDIRNQSEWDQAHSHDLSEFSRQPSFIYLSLRTDKLLKTGSLAIPGERVNIPDDVSFLPLSSTSSSLPRLLAALELSCSSRE